MQSVERYRELIDQGTTWVASDASDTMIGFISAEVIGVVLHIWELAVQREMQGRGTGKALIEAARAWSLAHDVKAITLTTFRSVPWNEPFYRFIGFGPYDNDAISPELAEILLTEIDAGLPTGERCAMVLIVF